MNRPAERKTFNINGLVGMKGALMKVVKTTIRFWSRNLNAKLGAFLDLPAPCISGSDIKIKINLNFYFHISLWCFERFYECLYDLHKTF